jgi:hypothetical protein
MLITTADALATAVYISFLPSGYQAVPEPVYQITRSQPSSSYRREGRCILCEAAATVAYYRFFDALTAQWHVDGPFRAAHRTDSPLTEWCNASTRGRRARCPPSPPTTIT